MSKFDELALWLLREEEELGTTRVMRGTMTIEECQEMFLTELDIPISERQASGLVEGARLKYEVLPELGVELMPIARPPYGIQYSYYSYGLHRFVSAEAIREAFERW